MIGDGGAGSRGARVVRGLCAASVAVAFGAVAHAGGGAPVPNGAGIVLAFVFATLASVLLAGRRLSRVRLTIAVLLSQGVFHVLFALTSGSSVANAAPGHGMLGMDMSPALPAERVAHAAGGMTGTLAALDLTDPWMLVTHLCAAALTIVLLVLAERSFWGLARTTLADWARGLATRLADAAAAVLHIGNADDAPTGGSAPDPDRTALPLPAQRALTGSILHRGPPAVLRAASA